MVARDVISWKRTLLHRLKSIISLTEADSGQTNEAVVESVEESPVLLNACEYKRWYDEKEENDEEKRGDKMH